MTTTLQVDGMTCGGCVQNVTRLLSAVPGVQQVHVTLTPGRAVVDHGAGVTAEQLIRAAAAGGFDVRAAA